MIFLYGGSKTLPITPVYTRLLFYALIFENCVYLEFIDIKDFNIQTTEGTK